MSGRVEAVMRPVAETDYQDLARFFEENDRPEITRGFHPFPLNAETAQRIACTEHLDRYFLAVCDGEAVGLMMLRGWDEGYQVPSFGVLVDHRHQGAGLGRQMTEFAVAEARRLGCQRLRLSVYASNRPALSLYLSIGFGEISREAVVVAGEPDVKITMVKDLQ